MTNDDLPAYDFGRLCRVFKAWYDMHGYSQSRLEEAGGPSGPVITKLYNGTWVSNRPRDVTEKVDRGFGWPPNTAWAVLARLDQIAADGEDEERRLRAALRNAARAIDRPGVQQARRRREAEAAVFELEEFLNRQAAAVVRWISERSVGGDAQDAGQYVESTTGRLVESGVTNEDLLREILRSRAESDRIAARLEVLETSVEAGRRITEGLSERVDRLEQGS